MSRITRRSRIPAHTLALALVLAHAPGCGESDGTPNPDGGPGGMDLGGASNVCVGGGSCADFDDTQCMSAELLGLSCTSVRGDGCDFGGLMIGQPSDPGCSAEDNLNDCVALSIGCRWDGASCSFKACHMQESEGACQAQGCLWAEDDCYFTDCTQLNQTTCQNTFGCAYWMNRFESCTGTYACDELDPSLAPPMTTPQALCEAAATTGLPCSWVP
ncbi:MAG: hypothetical protein R3B40_22335 [Polyangiales bacterium]|nr:hypothetical protein [Myxococcales bacterium]MCB9656804.1 hypothetical protein [Sandaracinaceae bacterium]